MPPHNTGLRLARERQPALLLLDIHLPEVSGTDVLHELRADDATRGLPVIVVSGLAEPVRAADRADVAAVHRKPFDLDGLRADVLRWAGPPAGRVPAGAAPGGLVD